jgi:hypothetical protein
MNFKLILPDKRDEIENFTWYTTLVDFNIPVNVFDHSRRQPSIVLKAGDVFGMACMDFQITSTQVERSSIILIDGRIHPVIVSMRFLELNSGYFRDITTQYLRGNKLKQILS